MLAEVGRPEDVDIAVQAARDAYDNGWSTISRQSGRSTSSGSRESSRSAQSSQLESLNGGKPIKESRDVDIPLAAAHFFYYAGWADKLEYAFRTAAPRPSASPARSSRGTSR